MACASEFADLREVDSYYVNSFLFQSVSDFVIDAITNIVAIYIMITDPRAGVNSTTSFLMVAGFIAVGFILFYSMKAYRKSKEST